MQANRKPAQAAAQVPTEYVTNWSAVWSVVAVVTVLGVSAAFWKWSESERQARETAAREQASHSPVVTFARRDAVRKFVHLRPCEADRKPPQIDLTRLRPHGGQVLRTLSHLGDALVDEIVGIPVGQFQAAREVLNEAERATRPWADMPASAIVLNTTTTSDDEASLSPTDAMEKYLLDNVAELDMQGETPSFLTVAEVAKVEEREAAVTHEDEDAHAQLLAKMTTERHDLQGLPLLLGEACQCEPQVAAKRNILALGVRRSLEVRQIRSSRGSESQSSLSRQRGEAFEKGEAFADPAEQFIANLETLLSRVRNSEDPVKWNDGSQVAILEQMLQVADVNNRHMLVKLLSQIEGQQASEALARRVLFDVDEKVRDVAIASLQERSADEYQSVIERGRNYPWTPVQQRGKELKLASRQKPKESAMKKAVAPGLDTPEPMDLGHHISPPYRAAGGDWVVDELVKVNHLRNCVMCHQVSTNAADPLRGQIPSPGEKLPRIYYSSTRGNFVRADKVYIRQDFSQMLPVKDHGEWPAMQRFDFFVRTRPATGGDIQQAYRQRDNDALVLQHAVIKALQLGIETIDEAVGNRG